MRVFALALLMVVLTGPVTSSPRRAVAAQEAVSLDTRDLSRGAAIFSRFCQRCHEPRGPAERTDREWVMIMQHMETRANMTTKRAALVLRFLLASNDAARTPGRSRSGLMAVPDSATLDPQTLDDGREIFRGSGSCTGCHGTDLGPGVIAPSLTDGQWRTGDGSFPSIVDIMRNGVAGTAMAPYPAGISDEMAIKVSAYVWAVAQGKIEP